MNSAYARSAAAQRRVAVSAIALALSMSGFAVSAQAQEQGEEGTPPGQLSKTEKEDIIVTGTLVRGIAPAGANVVQLTQDDVKATGIQGTAQLAEQLTQFTTSFNAFQIPSSLPGNTLVVNRPNLRGLPGANAAGGTTTLVMIDGHRIVGMGITSTTPDMDIVPPGGLAMTQIIPDGGSAQYGSDAVAGVINMITRREYDGAEISARYGFTGAFHNLSIDGTVGRKWSSGSAYVSYSFASNSTLRGYGLDFIRTVPSANTSIVMPAGTPNTNANRNPFVVGLNCNPGTVIAGTVAYALPFTSATAVPNTLNQCDSNREGVIYPEQRRHSVIAGLSQELSDTIRLDLRGVYMNRQVTNPGTFFRSNNTVTATALGFAQHRIGAETQQTVYYRFGPEDGTRSSNQLEAWQITPTITAGLGSNWQLRVLGSYGRSRVDLHSRSVNSTALTNAINLGLFNVYDPYSNSQQLIDVLSNFDGYAWGVQTMQNVRATIDGDLFDLPGGAVKVAVGGEFLRETLRNQNGAQIWRGSQDTGTPALTVGQVLGASAPPLIAGSALIPANNPVAIGQASRRVWSAFGEVVVPIFSAENATTAFKELTVSVAARYDRYSDVGDTFNPRVGLTWRPTNWVTLRGAWSSSFNAPSLADSAALQPTTINNLHGSPFIQFIGLPTQSQINAGTYAPYDQSQAVISLGGVSPTIRPQTAKTLSLGFDIEPPFVPGLRLSLTYWRLFMKGNITIPLSPYVNFPNKVYGGHGPGSVDSAFLKSILAQGTLTGDALTCSGDPGDTNCVYAIVDTRKDNLGDLLMRGLDFSIRYSHPTKFGSIDASFGGTYEIEALRSTAPGGPLVNDELATRNGMRFTGSLGATVGNFRGSLSWRHSHGYDLNPPVGAVAPFQDYAGSYNVFDTFFKLDFPKDKFALTLNVSNIFDQRPPVTISPGSNGTINGSTYGRMAQIGFNKKF